MVTAGGAGEPTLLLAGPGAGRLARALGREGFRVLTAADGAQALARWEADAPDLLLLDARLPGPGAVEVCRRVRRAAPTPVIVLAPGPREGTILAAFAAGADDVVAEPFGARQLTLRIRAILRRTVGCPALAVARGAPTVGGATLDVAARELRRGERAVRLTRREAEILRALMAAPGRVVPYARLGADPAGDEVLGRRAAQRHIVQLRRKVRAVAGEALRIEVRSGVGYRLVG